jgi:hypothetical protein
MSASPTDPRGELRRELTRRAFLGGGASVVGSAALASLLGRDLGAATSRVLGGGREPELGPGAALKSFHHPPKAKALIWLFMSGGVSQLDTFDHKPQLKERFDEDLPESVRQGQRLTTMTSGQARFPVAPSVFQFSQHGECGAWMSELLPHMGGVADDLAIVRSCHSEAINHDPAMTFIATGHQLPGRPSLGSWLSYGLGSGNQDLPTYVVMTPTWTGRLEAQALFSRMWGTGWLPSEHQGVALRAQGDPVLFLNDPPGVDREGRRRMLDGLAALNRHRMEQHGDPETAARIEQYEMAFRMQSSVPDLVDTSGEPDSVKQLYGPEVDTPGTFAASCLLARRMVEQGVRFVQIYIRGWDHHFDLPNTIRRSCRDVDQPTAGLVQDLKQRGLLDETMIVWGGEFGRTVYSQGTLTDKDYGRDHHGRCFTTVLAGGGVRGGVQHGATDDYSYSITEDPVHIHDLNATILHNLGIDHTRLTSRFQGRDFRLTDVHGEVVRDLLA